MTIANFLQDATDTLAVAGIATARLDALVLLSDILQRDKSWLLAHPEYILSANQVTTLRAIVAKRAQRYPLAYLRGHQAFYGREFTVTPDVLIPRPDTEVLVDLTKKYVPKGKIIDVGTGSGALAVTLALELPRATIEACDISQDALNIARKNAHNLKANVRFFVSDLLSEADGPYDAIVANLPYVASHWQRSDETHAEPDIALFAEDDGLALIKKLIGQAPTKLKPQGYLLLEADPRQHKAIEKAASKHRFVLTAAEGFGVALHLT